MNLRRPLVAGNWKMHTTPEEASRLAGEILVGLPAHPGADVLLLPPFTSLVAVAAVLAGDERVSLGAQNCHWEASGAVTGEVSAPMLAALCDYVLVGHSERRQLFHETDEVVRAKVEAVLAAGMRPILAVGETAEERAQGRTEEVLIRQVVAGLRGLAPEALLLCTVAYEPIWAIGTGAAGDPADVASAAAVLRAEIEGAAPGSAAEVRILYGGSVTADSAGRLLGTPGVAGALVGGASLKPLEFCAIVAASAR